jgi:hypothetical protein
MADLGKCGPPDALIGRAASLFCEVAMNDLPPNLPTAPMPRPPAQVLPYFETLGLELTICFLLTFGGADMYLSADPKGGSEVEAHIGRENLKALAALSRAPKSTMQRRVPLAKRWLTEVLHWQGHSKAAIARKLRITTNTVGKYLAKEYANARE